jgi:hypothetical protein
MGTTHITVATVTEDGQLHLDQKLTLPPGRVLVRVELLTSPPAGRIHILDVPEPDGPGRSRGDIDAQVASLRQDWPE